MSESETQAPRMNAATLAKYQHEERMAQATKQRGDLPSFATKRSTASGSLGVVGIDIAIPVCEEFPTAEDAFGALVDFTERAYTQWPMPDGYVRTK